MSYAPYNPPVGATTADPTAVSGRRVIAWIIDLVIYGVLSFVINLATGAKLKSYDLTGSSLDGERFCELWRAGHNGFCGSSGTNSVVTYENGTGGILVSIGLFVLFCVAQGLLGGSLGKLAVGLRIVKADGSQAGVAASFIRTLMWIVDAITCGLPIVGGVCMISSKGHRRVGDMAAGTYVVPRAQMGRPLTIPGLYTGSYGQPPYGQAPYGQPPYGQPPYGGGPAGGAPTYPPYGSTPTVDPGAQSGGYEADKPTWDAKRNTYIQYDSKQSAWLEFDQATQTWKPISQ